jgi:hypothetical protein
LLEKPASSACSKSITLLKHSLVGTESNARCVPEADQSTSPDFASLALDLDGRIVEREDDRVQVSPRKFTQS